jgi:hypothetical protein
MRMWLSGARGEKENENKVPELLFHQSLTNCLNPETLRGSVGSMDCHSQQAIRLAGSSVTPTIR